MEVESLAVPKLWCPDSEILDNQSFARGLDLHIAFLGFASGGHCCIVLGVVNDCLNHDTFRIVCLSIVAIRVHT